MGNFSLTRKLLAIFLIIVIVFTYCDMTGFADTKETSEGEPVGYAVYVKVAPSDEEKEIMSGNMGTFTIHARVAYTETGVTTTFVIKLPENLPIDSLIDFGGEGDIITSIIGEEKIHVTLDKSNRTISFERQEGETADIPIRFELPNGITDNTLLEIPDNYITVMTSEEIPGEKVIEGGSINITSDFEWSDVSKKTSTTGLLTCDSNNNLTEDLKYTITAASGNTSSSGERFTRNLTLEDTLTLPDGLNFIGNETTLDVDESDSSWKIMSGTSVIAEIAKPEAINTRKEFSYYIKDAVISGSEEGKRNKLEFTYICAYPEESELKNYKVEMPNPDLSITVKKDAVNIDDPLVLKDSQNIKNKVQMTATPVVGTDEIKSNKEVNLPLYYPGQYFKINKRSAVSSDEKGMILTYTIEITNQSEVSLRNLTIEDPLPTNVELVESADAKYDAAGRKLIWTNQSVPYNGKLTKTFKVRVKEGTAAGTKITNTAKAKVTGGSWKTSTVTDTVYSSDANMSISKTHDRGVAANALPGENVEYKVMVKNSGLGQASATITDSYSEYLTNLRDFKYSTDGNTWSTLTGYSIDEANRKITFCTNNILDNNPVTSYGNTIYYKYKATVSLDAPAEAKLNNTAKVTWEKGEKISSTTISVRSRLPKVTFDKTAENPRLVEGETDLYKIDYILTVKNEGDEVIPDDNVNIVDTMSDGLMPTYPSQNSGTITGTYTDASGNKNSITGIFVFEAPDKYKITWDTINSMPKGTSAKPSMVTIKYSGYIKVPDYDGTATVDEEIITAANKAELYLRGIKRGIKSSITPMSPIPVPGKVISKLNGQTPADPYSCEVKPGDVVEYTISITNDGTGGMIAEAKDTLPQPFIGSVFRWELNKNLFLDENHNQLGVPKITDSEGTQILTWENISVPAGETRSAVVKLKFPGPDQFNTAFSPSSGQRFVYNRLQVIAPDPNKPYIKKTWDFQVSHNIKAVVLNVNKTIPQEKIYTAGEEVIFTLQGFDTEYAVSGLSMTDDLTKVADYMDLKEINTGAYEGIETYDIILSYETWMPERTIHIANPGINTRITDSEADPFMTGVTSITWNFGTVNYLKIKIDPTIKMVVKKDVTGRAENGVTLYYNGKSVEDRVPISVKPDKVLKKTAEVNGKEVNNTDNQLQEGDKVTFHIYYDNPGNADVKIDAANPLVDHLTTKGLKAEKGIKVSCQVYNIDNVLQSGYIVTPASFNISDEDITSSNAKKLNFTLNKPLSPGYKLHLSYTVTVGSTIIYGQGEHRNNFENGWGVTDDKKIDDNPSNLYMLHNRVTIKNDGNNDVAETGFYYGKGENNLYFSKAVRGFSTYSRPRRNFLNCFMTNYSALQSDELTNFGNAKTKKYPANQDGGQCSTPDVFDVIFYVVTVANDLSSNDDLTVKNIKDVLPDNVVPVGTRVSSWNNVGTITSSVQFGLFYNDSRAEDLILSGNEFQSTSSTNQATAQYDLSDSYNRFSRYSRQYDIDPPTYATINAEDTAKITTIPEGYTAVDVDIDIEEYVSGVYNESTKKYGAKNYNTSTPTFRVFSGVGKTGTTTSATVRNAGVTLKPGEMFAFTYAVIIDRSKPEPPSWINKAYLNVGKVDSGDNFNIRGNLPAEEDEFITKVKDGKKASNPNISEGVRTDVETKFLAAPVVVGPEYKAMIAKNVAGHADDTDKTAALDTVKGYTYQSDKNTVKFGDIVKWKIVATNTYNTNISGATLKDIIPCPYEVIKGSNGEVATDYAGNMVTGTVTGSASGTYGKAGQTVTISGVNINANASKTYYIYTRYTGSEFKSLNYTNRAELYVNGTFTPTSGEPILDGERINYIGVADDDFVYPTIDGSTSSYKEIWEDGNTSNRGQGNIADQNSITVSNISGTVKYRLNLQNTGSQAYNNIVLIDKLPHVGDTGVVNYAANRGSQFDVALKSGNVTVKIINTSNNTESTLTKDTDYTIGFSNNKGASGFTSAAWTNGDGFTDVSPTSSTKSFRLALTNGKTLSPGEKLTVEFDAKLPKDSPGKTAWNNFGYSYELNGTTIYAEPAKVGVTVAQTSLTVKKVWNDGIGSSRPENITVSLFEQVGDSSTKTLIGKYSNLEWTKEGNVWTYTFKELPIKKNGLNITYSVEEQSVPGYNIRTYTNTDGSISINNTLTTSISGTKMWIDNMNTHERPTIILHQVVNGAQTLFSTYKPDDPRITWSDSDDVNKTFDVDKYTITGLPAYDVDNNPITYEVDEASYDGYKLLSNKNFDLVNVIYGTTELYITKVWKDNSDSGKKRPEKIKLQVYADSKAYKIIEINRPSEEQADNNQWTYTIEDLPKYSEKDGHEIVYTAEEIVEEGTPYVSQVTSDESGRVIITNTITEYSSLEVKKIWKDENDKSGERPLSLDVTVKQNGNDFMNLTLDSANNWTSNISGIPLYDENGVPYEYTATESDIPFYTGIIVKETKIVDGNTVITFILTNTRDNPTPTDCVIKAKKTFNATAGVDVNVSDFPFSLTTLKYDEAKKEWVIDETVAVKTANPDENGQVTFAMAYDNAGTYKYLLKEVVPPEGSEERNASIIYDESEVYVTVVVTRDGQGLSALVSYDEEGENWTEINPPEFINTYEDPEDIYVNFDVRKYFYFGEELINFGPYPFSAKLKAITEGAPMPEGSIESTEDPYGAKTVQFTQGEADGISVTSFGDITYSAKDIGKTYKYQITEVVPPAGARDYSVQYDMSVYEAAVTILKPTNSKNIEADINWKKDSTPVDDIFATFINRFEKPKETKVNLEVKKELIGRGDNPLSAGEFTFELYDSVGKKVGEATNGADGKVLFSGSDIDALKFSEDVGTGSKEYFYTIKEKNTGIPSIVYSEDTVYAKVVLTKNEKNELVTSVTYSKSQDGTYTETVQEFINRYRLPDYLNLRIKKSVTGDGADIGAPLKRGQYNFTLTEIKADSSSVPVGEPVSNGRAPEGYIGEVSVDDVIFPQIEYTEAGTYTYEIREIIPSDDYKIPRITYSNAVIKAVVTVVEEGNKLTATAQYYYKADESAEYTLITEGDPTITNVYNKPPDIQVDLQAKKQLADEKTGTGIPFKSGDFTFQLLYADETPVPGFGGVTNDADGNVFFEDVPVTLGNNIFKIKEIKSGKAGFTYDSTEYIAVVKTKVKDDDPNYLEWVSTTYYSDYADETENSPVMENEGIPLFRNLYTPPDPSNAQLKVNKVLTGKDDSTEQFTFRLKATEGKGTPDIDMTVKSGVGEVVFNNISIPKAGTYYYTIYEDQGNNQSIEYFNKEIYAKIVAEDVNNKLNWIVTYSTTDPDVKEGTAEIQTITNTYVKPTTTSIAINKRIEGADGIIVPEIKEGQFSFKLFEVEADGNPKPFEMTATNVDGGGVIFNLPVEHYTKEGTYYYIIEETGKGPEPSNPGISLSNEQIKVEVEVTRNSDNELSAKEPKYYYKGEGDNDFNETDAPVITNHYTRDDEIEETFRAIKTLYNGNTEMSLDGYKFKFTLKDSSGIVVDTAWSTGKNVEFTPIIFKNPGTYKFTIQEEQLNFDAPNYNPSITGYDGKIYDVIVEVTLDENTNKLSSSVTYKDGESIITGLPTFRNEYTVPDGTSVELKANKTLINSEGNSLMQLAVNQFMFRVYADGNRNTVITEKGNALDGTVNFDPIPIDTEGIHTFYIGEVVLEEGDTGYDPSITKYDNTLYKAEVEVEKSGSSNDLVVKSITYTKADGSPLETGQTVPTFVNEYTKPTETTLKLGAEKSYNLSFNADEFEFTLTPQGDAPASANADKTTKIETVGNGASAPSGDSHVAGIEFSEITFNEPGDYTYIIRETEGTNSSISYDSEAITAVVHVYRDDPYNKLTASVTYSKGRTDGSNEKLTFVNEYETPTETQQTISLTKNFVDKTSGNPVNFGDNVFRFIIEPSTETPDAPMPAVTEVFTTDRDASSQLLSFGEITFTEDVGEVGKTYVYKIKEDSSYRNNPSVEYDGSVITVTIKVNKDEYNNLHAGAPEYYDSKGNKLTAGAVFTNKYEKPVKTEVPLQFKKVYKELVDGVEIEKALKGNDFSFTLTPQGDAPGTELTVKNDENGIIDFGKIEFTEDVGPAGKTYTYVVSEADDGYPSITYDNKPITVEVTITKGTVGENKNHLIPTVVYKKDGEEIKADEGLGPYFKNLYTKPEPISVVLEVLKKYDNGTKLKGGEFSFILKDKDGNTVSTALNDENGRVVFEKLDYSADVEDETYEYTIGEIDGKKTGVIYDKKVITVKVRVTKGTEGENKNKLSAEVKYFVDDEEVLNPTFENRYAPPIVGTAVRIHVDKVYKNGTLNGNDFKFMLKSAAGNPYKQTKYAFNDRLGNIDFGYLDFFAEGEYKYTITEVTGDNNNIRYDHGIVNVTIKVTKTKYGTLTSSVEYEKDGNPSSTFVNEYLDPDKITVNIFANKVLRGRELEANEFSFILAPSGDTLGESYSVRNSADGIVSFGEITYDKEGIYNYSINELHASNLPNIIYDTESVDVTVTVTRNDDKRLEAKVDYKKAGKDDNTFFNIYSEKKTGEYDGLPVERYDPKTGDNADLSGHLLLLTASSIGLIALLLTGRKKKKYEKNIPGK